MYKISDKKNNDEEEAWHAAARDFLSYAYKFLENKLPEELLANFDPKKVTLCFLGSYLRPGSIYYKPDTNQIIVPTDVKINEIKGEEKSRLISLFVHELMHAIFQNYLNKETMENKIEKPEKGKYITSSFPNKLLSEGISYIFEKLYLLYGDKFILSKDEIIKVIKKRIQDERPEINRQKLDRNTPEMQQFKGNPIFEIFRGVLSDSDKAELFEDQEVMSEAQEALSKTSKVLKKIKKILDIPRDPTPDEQLLAADLLLTEYEKSNFDNIGKFILWVIKNHEQEAEKLAGDIAGLVRK